MISRASSLLIATLLLSSSYATAQVAPNAPADKPVTATSEKQWQQIEAAIAPLILQARRTYPEAKARYLAGLATGEVFFITTRLTDSAGHIEMTFLRVTAIAGTTITGRIANEIQLVAGYKEGDELTLAEGALVDWTISKPDGTEDGNVVGKFIDSYQQKAGTPSVLLMSLRLTRTRSKKLVDAARIMLDRPFAVPGLG